MKNLQRFIPALAAVLVAVMSGPALAQFVPVVEPEEFSDRAEEFLAGAGRYERRDAEELTWELEDALPETDSVFWQHGRLNPFAKALLFIEAADGPLERYRVNFTVEKLHFDSGAKPEAGIFLQVDRWNLGQVIRQEQVDAVGEENTAPEEEFGLGPDTSWRFVISPVQGISADVRGAARAELNIDDAAASCLGGDCLSPDSVLPDDIVWQEEAPAELTPWDTVAPLMPVLPFPVQQLELAESAGWLHPFSAEGTGLELGLDVNLGQDYVSLLTIHNYGFADDSVGGTWHQLTGVPAATAEEAAQYWYREAYECQRGEDRFAPAGSFCP